MTMQVKGIENSKSVNIAVNNNKVFILVQEISLDHIILLFMLERFLLNLIFH